MAEGSGTDDHQGTSGTDVEAHGETRALTLALALYVVVFALKLGAYFVSGVVAVLAEALHTLSDMFIVDPRVPVSSPAVAQPRSTTP
jgi:Co/Zn/Cd efflux system component